MEQCADRAKSRSTGDSDERLVDEWHKRETECVASEFVGYHGITA